MKNTCVALAAVMMISAASGCCFCRNLFKPKPVAVPVAPACAPAAPCCAPAPCGGCDSCGGMPVGAYGAPSMDYAPSGPVTYGNPAPLPAGP